MSIQRSRYVLVFVVLAAVAFGIGVRGSHGAVAAVSPVMNGYVHEDDSIGLNFADGTPVGSQDRVPPTIPPGTYTINVVDDADIHNFHLTGPGVDQQTDVGGTSTPTWTVTFQPGSTYRFQCDEHPDFMWGEFQTSGTAPASSGGSSSSGSSSSSTTSSSSSGTGGGSTKSTASAKNAIIGTLVGRVTAVGKATLTWGGIPVKTLGPGRYTITVGDKTKARSFVLQEQGHGARMIGGVAFVGTHSLTLTLGAGTWSFYASGSKTKSSFKVS